MAAGFQDVLQFNMRECMDKQMSKMYLYINVVFPKNMEGTHFSHGFLFVLLIDCLINILSQSFLSPPSPPLVDRPMFVVETFLKQPICVNSQSNSAPSHPNPNPRPASIIVPFTLGTTDFN